MWTRCCVRQMKPKENLKWVSLVFKHLLPKIDILALSLLLMFCYQCQTRESLSPQPPTLLQWLMFIPRHLIKIFTDIETRCCTLLRLCMASCTSQWLSIKPNTMFQPLLQKHLLLLRMRVYLFLLCSSWFIMTFVSSQTEENLAPSALEPAEKTVVTHMFTQTPSKFSSVLPALCKPFLWKPSRKFAFIDFIAIDMYYKTVC